MNQRSPSRIEAVTFDAGGTLVEPWPSVGRVYVEAACDAGFGEFSADEVDRRFFDAWRQRAANSFDYSRAAWARLVATALNGLTPHANSPELFGALWNRFAEARSWKIFDDVFPALETLKARGLRLAVVSNWDERLQPLLQRVGLAPYFEFILPSIEAPGPKPDGRIFAAAVARFGLPPATILHVGDSAREDWEGARRSGFAALLLDRGEPTAKGERIVALTEIARWLDSGTTGASQVR